jgi:hypothetical protein
MNGKTRVRAYAMWNFTKFVGAAAVLMSKPTNDNIQRYRSMIWHTMAHDVLVMGVIIGMAISSQNAIQSSYSSKSCTMCYEAAKSNPLLFYEFGLCSVIYTPQLSLLGNLMTQVLASMLYIHLLM